MNSETTTQAKSPAEILAEKLNESVTKCLTSSGLLPYANRAYHLPFEAQEMSGQNARVHGYGSFEFEACFGVAVHLSFRFESYGEKGPFCEIGMGSIGSHDAKTGAARVALYGKAVEAAALFDCAAEYLYDSFLRAQKQAEKAAKVVA